MADSLTPGARARARRHYDSFNVLNASSFMILSGSMITLFALKLGATAFQIGLLSSLGSVSFFFMPLGKALMAKRPIMTVYFWGWLLRYLFMIPPVAAPLLVFAGHPQAALYLLLGGFAGFNIARGIALIAANPVLAHLAEGGDRGAFLSRVQIYGNLAALATYLVMSLVLGSSPGTMVFALLIAVGVVIGIAGVFSLRAIPEPTAYRPERTEGLWKTIRAALREKPYRTFMGVFLILSLGSGMGRTFLVVYAKAVYRQGDDFVMILSFVASLAAVAVGLLSRIVIDRLGAKPLYLIYTFISILGLLPAIASPSLEAGLAVPAFLVGLWLIQAFGFAGQDGASQAYYFGLVPRERTLDLAVAYFFVAGIGGTIGALVGGAALDGLHSLGLGVTASWRVFYVAVDLVLLVAMVWMGRLQRLGSASVRESIESLLSFRDLRTFDLLTRLDASRDPREELALIHELGESGSSRSQKDLVGYLSSPRFELRREALHSLEALPELDEATIEAITAELGQRADTTGYIAARILGKRGLRGALPALRGALGASDPLLRGAAALALARLGDRESIAAIEELLRRDSSPRLRMEAAYALELFGSLSSIPALVASLSRDDPPAYLSDELVLAMASVLGMMRDYYPLYQAFADEEAAGLSLLGLSAAERLGEGHRLGEFRTAVESLFAGGSGQGDGAPLARLLLDSELDPGTSLVFADALIDPNLGYRGFRFLAAAWLLFGKAGTAA